MCVYKGQGKAAVEEAIRENGKVGEIENADNFYFARLTDVAVAPETAPEPIVEPTSTEAPVVTAKYVVTYKTYNSDFTERIEETKTFNTFAELTDFIGCIEEDWEYYYYEAEDLLIFTSIIGMLKTIDNTLVEMAEVKLDLDEETKNAYIESGIFDRYETEYGLIKTSFAGKSNLVLTDKATRETYVYAEKCYYADAEGNLYDKVFEVGNFSRFYE